MSKLSAQLVVIGGAAALVDALAAYWPPEDTALVADGAAAQAYLRAHGSPAPGLIVIEAGTSALAAVSALKADAQMKSIPLAVFCAGGDAGAIDACYRAGANACVIRPAASADLHRVAGALIGFWLGVNQAPPQD